jgi:hypothetical protein
MIKNVKGTERHLPVNITVVEIAQRKDEI